MIPLVVPFTSLSEAHRQLVLQAGADDGNGTQEQDELIAWSGRLAGGKASTVADVGDEGVIVGVLDIDCVDEDGFDEVDQEGLEECVKIIVRSCAW